MRVVLLLLSLSFTAHAADQSYSRLLTVTGIEAMIVGLNSDLHSATIRHARRCDTEQAPMQLQVDNLTATIRAELEKNTALVEVQALAAWYETRTGRKVTLLEQREVEDSELQQFEGIPARADQVARIYTNTGAGSLGASVAVELEYAGWLVSGCMEKVQNGGDEASITAEQIYGNLLKEQGATLETLFRQGTLHTMEAIFSPMSDQELHEFADITQKNSAVYSVLIDSVKNAIRKEVERNLEIP